MSYIKSFCQYCYNPFEFPQHGIGEIIDCPHCQKRTKLQMPKDALKQLCICALMGDGNEGLASRFNELKEDLATDLTQSELRDCVKTARWPQVKPLIDEVLAKDFVTPDEIESLIKEAAKLRYPLGEDFLGNEIPMDWYKAHILLSRDVPIMLGARESCYFQYSTIELHEYRKRTRSISFGGPTISIPIYKRLRFRLGHYALAPHTETSLRRQDGGNLYLTNTRLFFDGQYGNRTYRFSKIMGVNFFTDGFEVEMESGRNPFFITGNNDSEGEFSRRFNYLLEQYKA